MVVKRTWDVFVDKNHELYEWCADMTGKANNLSNAVRFRQRQVFFARNKDVTDLSDNEKEILDEVNAVLGIDMLSCKRSLTYTFLYNLLQKSHNPDFCADQFPKQSAEWVVKQTVQDMNDYYAALIEYSANPSRFTGPVHQVTKRKVATVLLVFQIKIVKLKLITTVSLLHVFRLKRKFHFV